MIYVRMTVLITACLVSDDGLAGVALSAEVM